MTEFIVAGYVDGSGVRMLVQTPDGQFPYVGQDETLERVETVAVDAMTPELKLAYDAEGIASLFGSSADVSSEVIYTDDAGGNSWLVHQYPDGSMISDRTYRSYDDMIEYVTGD